MVIVVQCVPKNCGPKFDVIKQHKYERLIITNTRVVRPRMSASIEKKICQKIFTNKKVMSLFQRQPKISSAQ